MPTIYNFLAKGGPVMIPILGLSVFTLACALERAIFWGRLLSQEQRIVHDVLDAARSNLDEAAVIAKHARFLPIGRFLLAPLCLHQPSPETFRLAMETTGDKEFIKMRKGEKLLETVVAISPLLGLLGTVTGLISTFSNLNIGGGGASDQATKAAAGIGEALLTTAGGMIVAILALLVLRVLVILQAGQLDFFSEVSGELELIYRQIWYEPRLVNSRNYLPNSLSSELSPMNVDSVVDEDSF
ncbi:MAG: MotA/TolQ/ExbB proton channel family protein [Acaryochloridaceae cyanobacterium SU_2_1]|nr:MotA/TolQ/ExbB proton channel family protein [Acaryochloridaceae cyanobacterium SU_2_1]